MKNWVKKIALSATFGLLALALLEILLFVFNDHVFRSSFYIFDPDLGFRVRPYVYFGSDRTNEFGFNDRDYPHRRRAGTYRILFLGDSFSWMGGLDGNYVSLLEKMFEKEFGPDRVEVINAGYSQTHTAEQLVLLEKFGLLYEPDLVLLAVFAGNDFYDADPQRKRIAIGGGMTDIFLDRDFYAVFRGQPLILKSRLLLYLQEKWRSWEREIGRTSNPPAKRSPVTEGGSRQRRGPCRAPVLDDYYLNSLYLRTQFNRLDQFARFAPNVTLIAESVLVMKALLADRHIDFAVTVLPDEVQVDSNVERAFLEHYRLDSSQFEWDRAQSILRQLCRDHSIPFLDLLAVFKEASRLGQKSYLPNNGHWNDTGNELAAQFFFSSLRSRVKSELNF